MTKKVAWLLALLYVGFIYATLGVVRGPVNFLREQDLLVLTLNSLFVAAGFVIWLLFHKRKGMTSSRIFGFIAVIFIYFLISQKVSTPEEQIHFLQYGLVGVLFIRAVQFHTTSLFKKYLFAIALSSLAGWVDELIQGLLPSRHYDVNDIFLNIASVCLGLVIYTLIPPKKSKIST